MKYLIIVLLLSGCSTWTNYVHDEAQCEFAGGSYSWIKRNCDYSD